jgi:alpha-tubulin suppressor-like RCC1 family protein
VVASAVAVAIPRNAWAEPVSVQVSAGYNDTCVRKIDGTSWCWGFNGLDELGDGTTSDASSPVATISVGTGVAEVSTGQFHTCARNTDGTLWCWGYDADGELGNGSTNGLLAPLQVTALGSGVAQVSTGYSHSCARMVDGTLWCWGSNASGQLGDGTTNDQSSPEQVTALGSTVAEVSAGADHTCARKTDGTVWCWGNNNLGQLGDGTNTSRGTPAPVLALSRPVVEISANNEFTCAREVDGTLWCWGGNTDGELGNNSPPNSSSSTPVQAMLGNAVLQVSAGDNGACAVETNHTLWCWGANFQGNLGDGTAIRRLSPVQVTSLGSNVVEVSMGVHTCAREFDGSVWCWGYNSNGQLGDSTTVTRMLPVKVPILTAPVPLPAPAGGRRSALALAVALVVVASSMSRRKTLPRCG